MSATPSATCIRSGSKPNIKLPHRLQHTGTGRTDALLPGLHFESVKMNSNRKDLIAGIVLALFALCYFYEATGIKSFAGLGRTLIDSAAMPKIWAGCLLLLSCALILRSLRAERGGSKAQQQQQQKEKPKLSPAAWCREHAAVLLTFAALFAYAALMVPLGFIAASTLYIFAQILILQGSLRGWYKALLLGVICSAASYFIFVRGLAVLLPPGLIFK